MFRFIENYVQRIVEGIHEKIAAESTRLSAETNRISTMAHSEVSAVREGYTKEIAALESRIESRIESDAKTTEAAVSNEIRVRLKLVEARLTSKIAALETRLLAARAETSEIAETTAKFIRADTIKFLQGIRNISDFTGKAKS